MAGVIPLIIGAAVSRGADMEAERRRQKLLDAMEAYQVDKARKSQAAIETLIASQAPDTRKAELEKLTAARKEGLAASVQAVQQSNAAPIAGKVSKEYTQSQDAAATKVAERTRRAIEQMSVMGAPDERNAANALRYGQAATGVDSANTAINNVGQAYRNSMGRVVANPWLKMAGSAMMAYGAAKLGSGSQADKASMAAGMGADSAGNFTYEDSAGNIQRSAMPYRKPASGVGMRNRLNNAYSLWGR